jgi:predicted lipoprotein with Yx(FWY)xxD motif
MKRFSIVPIGLVAGLLVAGCGGSNNNSSASSASPANAYGTPPTKVASTSSSASAGAATVSTKNNKLGTILAGPSGKTLYLFEADKGNSSACSGTCAKAWPPLTTQGSPAAAKAAVKGDLGTIQRSDGTTQVTYKGHPLYTFIQDATTADAQGEGSTAFGADWYVLAPSGKKIDKD